MIDVGNFTEALHAVTEIARTLEKPLTKEDIATYFSDMELSPEQYNMVYTHIAGIQAGTITDEEDGESSTESTLDDATSEDKSSDTNTAEDIFMSLPYVRMYLDDISTIPKLTDEELQLLYSRLTDGDSSAAKPVMDAWLKKVVDIAKTYAELDVNVDDVIQEGNMGLVEGVNSLLDGCESDIDQFLRMSIKSAMETYIDDTLEDDTLENSILGKIMLVNDAKEKLSMDLSREATTAELSEYTHISSDEIEDLFSLIKKKEN